jgi:hypothetical protein
MLDRRTAAKRVWSVWWRYACVLAACELAVLFLSQFVRHSSALAGTTLVFLVFHSLFQLILLGVATAILVRYHVRTLHVWAGAAIVNTPVLIASVVAFPYWFPCYLAATVLSVVWVIVVARTSYRLSDPRFAHLCRACFYDLRGLTATVCPECGTAVTAPAASPPRPTPAASR